MPPIVPRLVTLDPETRAGSQEGLASTRLGQTKLHPHPPQGPATINFHTWISWGFFDFCTPDSFSSM